MSKTRKKLLPLICAIIAVCVLLPYLAATARGQAPTYNEIPLYVEGIRTGDCVILKNITYVPLRTFCEVLNGEAQVSWDNASQTAVAEMPGLVITARVNYLYFEANGRYFYVPNGIFRYEDAVYVPLDALAKAFSAEIIWYDEYKIVDIGTDHLSPIVSGDDFYDQDDLCLLSRLIYAESGGESLAGMIGTGSVVLNRCASPRFPDTLEDVIFQPGQFDPVALNSINVEPSEKAIIAAKLCMEGYNTVLNSLFFYNPKIGNSTFFVNNCTFVITIGNHDFYV